MTILGVFWAQKWIFKCILMKYPYHMTSCYLSVPFHRFLVTILLVGLPWSTLEDFWERAKTVLRYKNKHLFFRFITGFLKTHRIVGLGHAPFLFWRVPASRRLYQILKTHITCTHVLLNIRHFGPENVFHTRLRLFLLVLLGDGPAWAVGYFKIRLCVRILK